MNKYTYSLLLCLIFFTILQSCSFQNKNSEEKSVEISSVYAKNLQEEKLNPKTKKELKVGAERLNLYQNKIKDKKLGLIVNPSSRLGNAHLVDTLFNLGFEIKSIFAPEHGFRGKAEAGEKIDNSIDTKTKIPIVSLYGKNKKPSVENLQEIEIILFDIQDVGARFYTYISTLHYVMEACAENKIKVIVLDRPNPNGHYVDGPILEPEYKSFVGMHPVPVVHGMTVGEYAQMINGEFWLKDSVKCDLEIIPIENYTHQTFYELPVKPSPNLPNIRSIYLYPSLCFFEGTKVSIGRGTKTPFQIVGNPSFPKKDFSFTPISIPGASLHPKFKNEKCFGYDLTKIDLELLRNQKGLQLNYLIEFYNTSEDKTNFFIPFFDKLAGNQKLRNQIIVGKSEKEIKESWQKDLEKFNLIRKKYLIYE